MITKNIPITTHTFYLLYPRIRDIRGFHQIRTRDEISRIMNDGFHWITITLIDEPYFSYAIPDTLNTRLSLNLHKHKEPSKI
jgi:hypothetical protein